MTVLEKREDPCAAKKPRFSVRVDRTGSIAVVRCSGRLCYEGEAKVLAEIAQELLRDGANLVLDLGSLEALDSAGIGQLVLTSMQARALDRDVCIANTPARVRMLLELTNVASLFEPFASVDAALRAWSEKAA